MGSKLTTLVYANSSRARCAIHSRDTTIRICSVPQLTRKIPFVKISSWDKLTSLVHNIFAGVYLFGFFKYGDILGITLWWRPLAPAWQASPWEHRPSSSAPYVVPVGPSMIRQHIVDEPCAKRRALLGVLSSRFQAFLELYQLKLGLPHP